MTTSSLLLIGGLGAPELILILIVVLVLFGGKKIPELMRGMGVGIKNFKDGVNGINDEIKKDVNKAEEADKKEDKYGPGFQNKINRLNKEEKTYG